MSNSKNSREEKEMGRELKRVPLDFNYPLNHLWLGYAPSLEDLQNLKGIVEKVPEILLYQGNVCESCDKKFNNCSESASYCVWYNPDLRSQWFMEPPVGDGYQLWETTSEGSPVSPVFETLEELCQWCEVHASTFSSFKATKEQWQKMLSEDNVHHTQGNMTFL
jgi:hypothetical protein